MFSNKTDIKLNNLRYLLAKYNLIWLKETIHSNKFLANGKFKFLYKSFYFKIEL